MTLIKAVFVSVLIVAVLALDSLSNWFNRLLWGSPLGSYLVMCEARYVWADSKKSSWQRWAFILGVRK